jgi:large subunit ribosomal protein L9
MAIVKFRFELCKIDSQSNQLIGPRMPTKHRNQVRKGPHGGMQLVLTEDVPNLGQQGDLVEVKPGYGRNYLLPNGLATVPTEHNLRLLDRYKQRVKAAREARIADLKVMAEQIQRITVTIEANANEEGHLYGSVGAPEISKALKAQNLNVETEMVRLEGPIRECALYAVKVQLGFEIDSEVKVLVVKQQEK